MLPCFGRSLDAAHSSSQAWADSLCPGCIIAPPLAILINASYLKIPFFFGSPTFVQVQEPRGKEGSGAVLASSSCAKWIRGGPI